MELEANLDDNHKQELILQENEVFNKTDFDDLSVLLVNIRGLQTNHKNLELFIKNFSHKPDIIVCTETGILPCHNLYNLNDYNYGTYYNQSKINKADGVLVYINNELNVTTNTIEVGRVKFLNTTILLKEGRKLKITSLYRCHTITKEEFIHNMVTFLEDNKKVKNHLLIGDFNINLMDNDRTINDYKNNLFLQRYYKTKSEQSKIRDMHR